MGLRRLIWLSLVVQALLGWSDAQKEKKEAILPPLLVHFIYEGNISDYAINYALDKSRVKATELFYATYGRAIKSTFSVTQIQDMPDLFASLVEQQYHAVICAGNPDLCSALTTLAGSFPTLRFSATADNIKEPLPPNVMALKPRAWRGLWLAGLACGLQSKSNRVGLILPGLKLSTIQYANAFYLGLQTTRPGTELGLALVDGYNVSVSSRAAAESLVDWGAGCMTAVQSNAVPYQVFRDASLPSVGYSINVRILAGEHVQTSFLLDYTPLISWHLELLNNDSWLGASTLVPTYSVVRRGDWSLQVDWSKRQLLDTYVAAHQSSSFRLFCSAAFQTLSIPTPSMISNSTDGCLPSLLHFDPTIMILTPHAKIIAVWDTDSATNRVYWSWTHAMSIVCLSLAMALGLFSIYTIPHIVWYRKSRVYTVPSWLVILMVPISSLFTLASIAPYLGRPTVVSCTLRIWLESIGIIILTGSILARNYKHYTWKRDGLTVITKDFLKRFTVNPYELFVMFLTPLLLAQIIILVFWTSVTPMVPEFKSVSYLPFGSVESSCRNNLSSGPEYAWYAFNGVVCLANLAFLFVLKNMPLLTGEVISSGAVVLNAVVLYGITYFVAAVVGRATVTIAIIVWLKLIIVAVAMFVLIAPKWWAVQIKGVTEEVDVTETSNHTDSSSHGFVSRPSKSYAPQFYSESSVSSVGSPISGDEYEISSEAVFEDGVGEELRGNTGSADSTPASTRKDYTLSKSGKAPSSDKDDGVDRELKSPDDRTTVMASPTQEDTSPSSHPSEEEDSFHSEQSEHQYTTNRPD